MARSNSRRWQYIPVLVFLFLVLTVSGCLIPRAVGKTVGGVVRGTGNAIGAVTDVVSAPLK